jgi:catechol 2,3-dioxygenase-like lactoylglutathione lyase family enzyme
MKSYQSANERGELLLDHVIITVKDLDRSIAFYETALKPLGSVHALDYDGKNGPEGIPTSRASDGTGAYSSGSGRAMRTPKLPISALSPGARPR